MGRVELSKRVFDTLKIGGVAPLRQCSICNCNIGYVYRDETIMFDASCGCSERSDLRPADYNDMMRLSSIWKE